MTQDNIRITIDIMARDPASGAIIKAQAFSNTVDDDRATATWLRSVADLIDGEVSS
ncbi:hypothetical protein BH10PSE12_BH10PSE12_01840 [soil metagenome]